MKTLLEKRYKTLELQKLLETPKAVPLLTVFFGVTTESNDATIVDDATRGCQRAIGPIGPGLACARMQQKEPSMGSSGQNYELRYLYLFDVMYQCMLGFLNSCGSTTKSCMHDPPPMCSDVFHRLDRIFVLFFRLARPLRRRRRIPST